MKFSKKNWLPPTSFEEKIKHLIIPGKLYIRRLVLKEWIKGRTDIKFLKYLIDNNRNSLDVGAYKGVYTYFRAPPQAPIYQMLTPIYWLSIILITYSKQ